ncbi:stage V sporulation protein AC [Natranaerobius thermophilus JW/NM-WN-LF]|uniref:Stage V sporulation protein AC n=2 Tax=Natranaerobius TaxID=375928 RepID=B2A4Z1_NATTJ|nr:stage V sporulation protein AC [Natranaerobius thermophilus]ACB85233.1 stage V sporulation protein AC [Natranaerobius thermophilus JW/NM-WN-LF]
MKEYIVEVMIMDKRIQQNYSQLAKEKHPKPPLLKNVLNAFVVGGLICVLGQAIYNLYMYIGYSQEDAVDPAVATIIFLAALATGLGVFDKIAKFAGAGTAVPVTGFANSITSSALEFKREGYVLGVASKMFILAGSVIVYGVVTAFIIGLISAII